MKPLLLKRSLHTILKNQSEKFRLKESFTESYSPSATGKQIQFGFNGVGELAYKRSYARVRDDRGGRQE